MFANVEDAGDTADDTASLAGNMRGAEPEHKEQPVPQNQKLCKQIPGRTTAGEEAVV